MAQILEAQGRFEQTIAECERALALDPTIANCYNTMADAYRFLGQFEKNIEFTDKAILLSPRDRSLAWWYDSKAYGYFALKDYDKAADWAQRAIVANPNIAFSYTSLAPALAMSGRETEARDAIRSYLALHGSGLTIAAATALKARFAGPQSEPRVIDFWDRWIEGLRKAGLPEQ